MNGGAKIPGLEVKTPRGIARTKDKKVGQGEKAEGKEIEVTSDQKLDYSKEDWIQGRLEASKRYRTREGRQQEEKQTND